MRVFIVQVLCACNHDNTSSPLGKWKWLEESGLKPEAAYQFDKRPDTDNLVYQQLYRGHIAKYFRGSVQCIGQSKMQHFSWKDGRNSKWSNTSKKDASTPRYHHKQEDVSASNITIIQQSKGDLPEDSMDYISCDLEEKDPLLEEEVEGMTAELYIRQSTKRYNETLLKEPHNVDLWLEFIRFQDEAMQHGVLPGAFSEGEQLGQKFARGKINMAYLERKIAIYEKALEKNPINDDLLLGYMALCKETWQQAKIIKFWKDLVFRQPQKVRLWMGYIQYCQTRHSYFTTSNLLNLYSKAITTVRSILEGTLVSHRPEVDAEESLLALFVHLCYFLTQVGHTEKAIAAMQAMVEFNFFVPEELSRKMTNSKEKLEFFEPFWDSGVPRFGEDGAEGWRSWLDSQNTSEHISQSNSSRLLLEEAFEPAEEMTTEEETQEELSLLKEADLISGWVALERYREKMHFLPWKSKDSEEEPDDPDKIVLFDDINSLLFTITSEETKQSLLMSFLHFAGAIVPLVRALTKFPQLVPSRLSGDMQLPATALMHVFSSFPLCKIDYLNVPLGTSSSSFENNREYSSKVRHFIHSLYSQSIGLLSESQNHHLAICWLTTEFSSVLPHLQSHYEKNEQKQSKSLKKALKSFNKFAKALLKEALFRDVSIVWSVYGLLRAISGDREEAMKVVTMVMLQLIQKNHQVPNQNILLTCKIYAEVAMGMMSPVLLFKEDATFSPKMRPFGAEEIAKVKHYLLCLGEEKLMDFSFDKLTPVRQLKSEKRLSEMVQRHLSTIMSSEVPLEHDLEVLYLFAVCHSYLVYAISLDIQSAKEVIERLSNTLKTHQSLKGKASQLTPNRNSRTTPVESNILSVVEKMLVINVTLMRYHSSIHITPPSYLQTALMTGISLFPEQMYFLSVYSNQESSSYLIAKARRFLDSAVDNSGGVVPWLVSLNMEHRRLKVVGTNQNVTGLEELKMPVVHRVRSLYSRAVKHPAAQTCPLLWRSYLLFEVSH